MKLDLIAILIMVIGYAVSLYATDSDVLGLQTRLLLLSPLVLARAVFTVLAVLLLFLRFFPHLLRLGSRLAQRGRSVAPMMALAQLARTPRRSMRLSLLLALTTGLTIFTLVFTSSQEQRALDVAAFQVGTDISGMPAIPFDQGVFAEHEKAYSHLPGISAATLGYRNQKMWGGSEHKLPATILAMDAATLPQTALWPQGNSQQPMQALAQQLVAQRPQAIKQRLIPALVDSLLWQQLHLSPGATFTVIEGDVTVFEYRFIAVAQVQHIPTVSDGGGFLVDFQTFAQVRHDITSALIPLLIVNTAWFHVSNWERARASLQTGPLALFPDTIRDRQQLIDAQHREPLYLNIVGVLLLGSATALLLALFGMLLSSWLSAKGRLTGFAVLRALGAAPKQIAGTLSWEELIVYITALALGVLFGIYLSSSTVPALLFTSASNVEVGSQEFFRLQNIPPAQVIVPVLVVVALVVLACVCLLALAMMVRIVSRPVLAQTLRLNED